MKNYFGLSDFIRYWSSKKKYLITLVFFELPREATYLHHTKKKKTFRHILNNNVEQRLIVPGPKDCKTAKETRPKTC
ncbi:uncharacterized protein OCT59_030077 [Rhizophagus irregularis]|uniref:uncharacterized protein n=1 Tax=Rhizophagus irregularis TaxID=588596 RepID=UPI00332D285C|nr:hypothetical protein OCT59_030077 [Rhizophagus irregularis]